MVSPLRVRSVRRYPSFRHQRRSPQSASPWPGIHDWTTTPPSNGSAKRSERRHPQTRHPPSRKRLPARNAAFGRFRHQANLHDKSTQARPTVSRADRVVISASRNPAITGAGLLRMISIDVQSSRSVPLSNCFTAIPIEGKAIDAGRVGLPTLSDLAFIPRGVVLRVGCHDDAYRRASTTTPTRGANEIGRIRAGTDATRSYDLRWMQRDSLNDLRQPRRGSTVFTPWHPRWRSPAHAGFCLGQAALAEEPSLGSRGRARARLGVGPDAAS
jgi:hypothetical protein